MLEKIDFGYFLFFIFNSSDPILEFSPIFGRLFSSEIKSSESEF